MIKPSIGRIVWFHPTPKDPIYSPKQVLAAIVAAVHSDTSINLSVFGADGSGPYARQNVYLQQDGNPTQEGVSFAAWMPYQQGQAAKTEQLEAKLAGDKNDGQRDKLQELEQLRQQQPAEPEKAPSLVPADGAAPGANTEPAPPAQTEQPQG